MSTLVIPVLSSSLVIILASLAGVVFAWKLLGNWLKRRLRLMVAFSAGIFLVIIWHLAEELLHEGITLAVGAAFILGGVLLEVITRLLPHGTHHHHGPHPDHAHGTIDARRLLIGDSVHNVHDGLALVPAFLVSPWVGFATAGAILLHEVVQEVSEFFVYREAGYSIRKALLWNLASSSTIFIGVLLASLLVSTESFAEPLIAFSAGSFLYVLVRDLFPSILSHARTEKRLPLYVLMVLCGMMLMFVISYLAPHEAHEENKFPLPEGFELAEVRTPNNRV